jgi:predicted ArsR family transcriptional regulator
MYSYHNTTNSTGQRLDQYENKAKSQDDRILEWFNHHQSTATPSYTLRVVFSNSIPLTSVRRSLSNLTKAGLLVKTDHQVSGPYGRPEHCWKLPTTQLRLL